MRLRKILSWLYISLGTLVLASPISAQAAAVETFQIVVGNEVDIASGSDVLYYENVIQLQKSWASFDRSIHTLYLGTELLIEPKLDELSGESRFGVDTTSAFLGYKYRTYVPDWYNFNIRIRVPVYVPGDPFGRATCPEDERLAPGNRFETISPRACAEARAYHDRLQLIVDPLIIRKSWNLFTVFDNNRLTLLTSSLEYSNKLRLIDVTPDLEFPIALYVGDEVRLRKSFDDGGRVRNDTFVGVASNIYDWLNLGVEFMYHLDTDETQNGTFVGELYLELYFDIFFDNTTGAPELPGRQVYEGETRG